MSAPVTTHSNALEAQGVLHRALSTPTLSQPQDEGLYFEIAQTGPSDQTS